MHRYVQVVRAGKDFVGERSKYRFGTDIKGFVYDGCYGGIFVDEDLAYESFVGKVLGPEIKMSCFT